MSAVYAGRQRQDPEDNELNNLYLRAMDSLQTEDPDQSGTRTPVGVVNGPGIHRDPSPYDSQLSYGRPPPSPVPIRSNPAPAPKSRPLPVVPGSNGGPRPTPPAPPVPSYGYPDQQRSSIPAQAHQNNSTVTYIPQTHEESPFTPTPNNPYPSAHQPTNQYSEFSPSSNDHYTTNSSYSSHDQYHASSDSYALRDPRYATPASYDGYGSNERGGNATLEPSAYGYGPSPTTTHLSQMNTGNSGYYSDRMPPPAQVTSAPRSSYSIEPLQGDPRIVEPYGVQRQRSQQSYGQSLHSSDPAYNSSPSPSSNYVSSPLQTSGSDDAGQEIGSYLLARSGSFASVASLLEPGHSPMDPLLTPTPTSSNPPTSLSHGTSGTGPPHHQLALAYSNYVAPVIVTPVESTPGSSSRRQGQEYRRIASMKGALELHDEDSEDEDEDPDEDRFINLSLLSHLANRLRDKVPRGTHVKGSIPYPRAFTGKDIVSTIHTQIQKEFQNNFGFTTTDRRAALQVARSLQSQLFFYEVEWGGRMLQDGLEDVYMFLDDNPASEGNNMEYRVDREELPTGVISLLTKCYAPSCQEGSPCYSYSCPRRANASTLETQLAGIVSPSEPLTDTPWGEMVDSQTLGSLPESEIRRQTIISKVIMKEQQYVQDLDLIETIFIKELRKAKPPVIPPEEVEDFIHEVFGNFFELRQCNRRLLDVMLVRQREQGPIIQRIGDIFLGAAAEFRTVYPIYVGNLPIAEKRIKEEAEQNSEFRRFMEYSSRQDARGLDMKHFIHRPSEHLQKYPVLLEAIFKETAEGNPDADFLVEAEQAIRNLSSVAQLRTFQTAMGRGPTSKMEWHDLVPKETRANVPKQESQRQAIIWELIKGEMIYVKDLETIETLFIRPLRENEIIPRERLASFLQDVFHNFAELHGHHRRMLDRLQEIQREEHPFIRTITAPVFDAALNWRDAYLEYIPHYPIAAFRIDDEMANNPSFKAFVDQCTRHPDARKLDLKAFINRPIPRLLRYELLLKNVLDATPPNHEDQDAIPQVLEVIKDLGKATEPGVQSAKQKVELWRYHANLVFKPGEVVDMDLLDDTRTLIHTGKLLRQPETGFDITGGGWTDLFVLLFDNYLVFTKPREKDGIIKYHVNRRPIPLDLLSLLNFNDPPSQRSTSLLRPRARTVLSGTESTMMAAMNNEVIDNRFVYPLHLHHNGRSGGIHTYFTESQQQRQEWKSKLEEALGLRSVVQESNRVFEIETLSVDTFLVPSIHHNTTAPSWNEEGMFTGKVTCSVPFTTADGRGLVAIGCAEGVWIGLRHDSKSMRRVLHLKLVTQCAMLEDFGIFLVLADKSLFAYHIEALVPSNPPSPHATRTPQKLNGNKDVQFFSVGSMGGRTLIIYMKRRGMDSVFRVLEPVVERITEKARQPGGFGRFAFGQSRTSEWFRIYRQDFFLPSEAFDLYFLKAKIAILCTKGFEVMDLTDFNSVTIPQREDPRLASWSKRLETCKPLGMFRSSENEFLLCYNEFGMYVDRHGDPSRQVVTVEWEGTAEKVACHPPYVLLFDPRFIEIRHIETGRLAQIIPGHDVRCLWDGRGGSAPPLLTPGPDGWQEGGAQDARVHATMRAEEVGKPNGQRPGTKAVAQHVFELLPTIPLYLPGSLASPSQSTYFPQSSSPPHSPRLNPAWRG